MERTEHTKIIQNLIGMVKPENQAEASNLLTQLSEDYEATLTVSETLATNNETLKADFEKLRKVNGELFLKVGEIHKTTEEKTEEKQEETPEIPSFDSLFNDKGELL